MRQATPPVPIDRAISARWRPRWPRLARFLLLPSHLAYLLCLALPLGLFAAQSGRPTQYDVEAVYLYQFGRFVAWPAQNAAPQDNFPICIMGRDPFGASLDSTIAGENINQLPLKASRIASVDDAKRCRILYISPSEDARLGAILQGLQQAPVLTVSDAPDFLSRGGMIQFVLQGNRVRFEINVSTAQKSGLTVSSDLLKVASSVRGVPASGASQ